VSRPAAEGELTAAGRPTSACTDATEEEAMTWSRVLVGVDGSAGSKRALRYAADEAEVHGATLTVLLAYAMPVPPVTVGLGVPPLDDPGAIRQHAQDLLTQTVRDTLGDDPAVRVDTQLVEGSAAGALIDASQGCDLLVVGTRGHGGFAGMLLGSVSQHLAAHAACTVAVVR
jgi:nucleotide-binding universal stress UspA family protein